MKTFRKYLLINILLIFFHVTMLFIAVMGIGGGTGHHGQLSYLENDVETL